MTDDSMTVWDWLAQAVEQIKLEKKHSAYISKKNANRMGIYTLEQRIKYFVNNVRRHRI